MKACFIHAKQSLGRKRLMKKATLITGAGSGLGKEFALLYASKGNNVVLIDINKDAILSVKEEIQKNPSVEVFTFVADLSKEETYAGVFNFTKENELFINNLVNCAGFGDCKDFKDMEVYKQIAMTNVCCNALLYFSRVYLDDMLTNNEGHIINVCSIAGLYPGPYMCTYHAVKGYVYNLSSAISFELRNTNIKCLTLCPGPFNSKFVSEAHNDFTFKKKKPLEAKEVAQIGYTQSMKGKDFYIIGKGNRFQYFMSRFVTRKTLLKTSAKTLKAKI